MSRILYGKDIFDIAYSYVKNLFLKQHTKSVSVVSKSTKETYDEKLTDSLEETAEPITSESESSKDTVREGTETVRESVESTLDDGVEVEVKSELEERFPFILASVCCDLERLDVEYRRSRDMDEQGEFSAFFIGLDDAFPLCERFIFPCAMYACSMFLIDSDGDRSDEFFAKYSESVSEISAKIPFELKETVEKYPY